MISELHSMAIRTRGFFDRGGGKDLEKWLCGMVGIEKKKAIENTLLGIWYSIDGKVGRHYGVGH
uniref:Uncharacterized protein n=1 Tax=Picea sitchensis TaxID=3332 RepID=B8LPN0_PICSI|nr:unknown [Picea sitchensis]